jgi:hypothetical protein
MTAYLDNNIIVNIEDNYITKNELLNNIDNRIVDIYYSAAHLQEAHEIKGIDENEIKDRLNKRIETIQNITSNNYLFHQLPSNKVLKLKENPLTVYKTITEISFGQNAMKSMMNIVDEEQKELFRNQLNIDRLQINNYSAKDVVEHLNKKLDVWGGYSLIGIIEKATELHPQGKEFGLHNNFGGIFELLDLVGYWKDKFNEKSNYARLWDANHAYFSSFCDYFVSDDKRTRNKAKVVFEIYGINTIAISSKGEK